MSATDDRPRAPMTYDLISCRGYGYAMAAIVALRLDGIAPDSAMIAEYLASRQTPYESAEGALGVGWYPMSVARLLTQVRLHGYPIERDPETGAWLLGRPKSRAVADAISECYRLCAVDDRPRRSSYSF